MTEIDVNSEEWLNDLFDLRAFCLANPQSRQYLPNIEREIERLKNKFGLVYRSFGSCSFSKPTEHSLSSAISKAFDDLRTVVTEKRFLTFGIDEMFTDTFPVIADPTGTGQPFQELDYPLTCTPSCDHRTCPFYRIENFGRPCLHKTSSVPENP